MINENLSLMKIKEFLIEILHCRHWMCEPSRRKDSDVSLTSEMIQVTTLRDAALLCFAYLIFFSRWIRYGSRRST